MSTQPKLKQEGRKEGKRTVIAAGGSEPTISAVAISLTTQAQGVDVNLAG
jgi:hypothetical protein